MRIPARHLERAFSELDGFTPGVAEWMIARTAKTVRSMIGIGVMAGYAAFLVVVPARVREVATRIGTSDVWRPARAGARMLADDWDTGPWFTIVIITALVAGIGALIMRDAAVRRGIRRALRRASCPACGHTLIGGRRTGTAVECAGCCTSHTHVSLGVRPVNLGPPQVVLAPIRNCHRCTYSLEGIGSHEGMVRCPECGHSMVCMEERVV